MAQVTELPADLVIDDVAFVVYTTPYFALDVSPVAGLSVSDVQTVALDGGTAYAGTFVNSFSVTVTDPVVMVYPVNSVGRPLGVASASGTDPVDPSGTWSFQTNALDVVGTSYAAFPAGTLPAPMP